MSRSLTCAAILAALFLSHGAALSAGACVPDQHQSFICGEGDSAMRVFPDTVAPSRKFAFAWRSSDGISSKDYDPEDVENLLIRLEDGEVMAKLDGSSWDTGEYRANHHDLLAAWSPDSRAVVEVANSRWDTDSFAYYAVDGATVRKLDLLPLVAPAVRAKLPRSKRESQSFRVREDQPLNLDSRGRLRFAAMLYVPKSADSLDFQVDVAITSRRGKPAAQLASLKRIKLD